MKKHIHVFKILLVGLVFIPGFAGAERPIGIGSSNYPNAVSAISNAQQIVDGTNLWFGSMPYLETNSLLVFLNSPTGLKLATSDPFWGMLESLGVFPQDLSIVDRQSRLAQATHILGPINEILKKKKFLLSQIPLADPNSSDFQKYSEQYGPTAARKNREEIIGELVRARIEAVDLIEKRIAKEIAAVYDKPLTDWRKTQVQLASLATYSTKANKTFNGVTEFVAKAEAAINRGPAAAAIQEAAEGNLINASIAGLKNGDIKALIDKLVTILKTAYLGPKATPGVYKSPADQDKERRAAFFELGKLYRFGWAGIVPANRSLSDEFFEQATAPLMKEDKFAVLDPISAKAHLLLAWLSMDEGNGHHRDLPKAYRHMQHAVTQGLPDDFAESVITQGFAEGYPKQLVHAQINFERELNAPVPPTPPVSSTPEHLVKAVGRFNDARYFLKLYGFLWPVISYLLSVLSLIASQGRQTLLIHFLSITGVGYLGLGMHYLFAKRNFTKAIGEFLRSKPVATHHGDTDA